MLAMMKTDITLSMGPATRARVEDIFEAMNSQQLQAWLVATTHIPSVRRDGPPPGIPVERVLQEALAIGLTGLAARYGLGDLQHYYLNE